MSIFITNESDIEYPECYDHIIMDVINGSMEYLKCPYPIEVSVMLTDNNEIHENSEGVYRGYTRNTRGRKVVSNGAEACLR